MLTGPARGAGAKREPFRQFGGGWRLRRVLGFLVGAILSIPVLYLAAMNSFLSTRLFARVIDGQPDIIDVHFRRGWSWVPGHIHAEGLSIRGRDGSVEWILRLDTVEFDVSLAALARRRFEASHVYGRGASFRLRQRLDSPPATQAEVADLPPIEGLPPYSMRPPPQPEPGKWSDAFYNLWAARLEDVVASDVREVWVDHHRFEGHARIAGRFYLKPVRRAEIGPIRIDVHDGRVRTGGFVIVERLANATVDVEVAPFDPRTLQASELLGQISLQLRMAPACPDIARLPLRLPHGIEKVTGEADVREMVVDLRRGAIQEGTKIDAVSSQAVVTGRKHRFVGAAAVVGAVTRVDGQGRLDFRAQLTDVDVHRANGSPTDEAVVLHVPRMTVTGDARVLDLANALADVHLVANVTGAALPDLAALTAYIPQEVPLAWKGGTGKVSVHLETWRAERRAAGNAELEVEDLNLRLGNMRMHGRASVDVSFGSFPWEASLVHDAKLSLRVLAGTLASEQRPGTPLVRVSDLRADTHAAAVALEDPLRALSALISLECGEVVDPDLLRAYLPKEAEMHVQPEQARFSLGCELTLDNHLANGTLSVDSKALGLAFRDFRVRADVLGRARVHDWHWERGDLGLDEAHVDLSHVLVDRDGTEAADRPAPPAASDGSPSTSKGAALSFARISLGARSRHFSLIDPLRQVELSASFADARVHDSAIVNAFLPTGAPFAIRAKDGSFSSDVQATVQEHILEGTVAVRAQRMGIGGKAFFIGGDIDVLAHVSDWDFAANTLAVQDARVLFSNVAGAFHGGAAESSDAAHASALASKTDFRAVRIDLWAKTPALDLVKPSRRELDARVAIVDAELPDATVFQRLLPTDSILAVESGRARVTANLDVSSTERTARGRLDVDLAHTGIRFHETHLAGNFKLSAQLLGYDPDRDLLDVSGSRLTMRDVAVTNASTDTLHWRGDVALEEASLCLGSRPELDGRVTIEALDASPILAILLGNSLPKIFVGLTSMPHLSGAARLTMGARHVALRDLDAHGGDLSIEGTYVLGQGHRAGAFVVGKGPFSAGFHLDDAGAHLRFFGLDGWLRDETRASLRLLDEPAQTSDVLPSAARP